MHQVFEDNETAYMALDCIDGQDLLDIVEDGKQPIHPEQVRKILLTLLDAVAFIHEKGILHRDISPDNILIDEKGRPILIDFGAAREKATRASRALSALMVVKDGYSPQEFYVNGSEQGPASDLSSLAATFYHVIAGDPPPNSQTRLAAVAANKEDPYEKLVGRFSGFEREFLQAIDQTLSIFPKDRIQNARDWSVRIDAEKRVERALATAKRDRNIDRAISRLVVETNKAVLDAVSRENAEASQRAAAASAAAPKKRIPEILSRNLDDDWETDTDEPETTADAPATTEAPATNTDVRFADWTPTGRGARIGSKLFIWRRFRRVSTWRFWNSDKSQTKHLGRAGS